MAHWGAFAPNTNIKVNSDLCVIHKYESGKTYTKIKTRINQQNLMINNLLTPS